MTNRMSGDGHHDGDHAHDGARGLMSPKEERHRHDGPLMHHADQFRTHKQRVARHT